jgi:hypothetical protein
MDSPRMAVDDLALVKGASLRLGFCYFVIVGPGAHKVNVSRLQLLYSPHFYLTSRPPPPGTEQENDCCTGPPG